MTDKFVKMSTGKYAYKDMRIVKLSSGKIIKRTGWEVYNINDRTNKKHFNTLKEAKEYVLTENL